MGAIILDDWRRRRREMELRYPQQQKEIQDLIKAYNFARTHLLKQRMMLRVHKTLSQQFLVRMHRGKYRPGLAGVNHYDDFSHWPLKKPFVTSEMTLLFDDIVELMAEANLSTEEAFYYASSIHLRFLLIQPFFDGNGRVARLLEKWFLATRVGNVAWKIPSKEYYSKYRHKYDENFQLGWKYQIGDHDKCLPFLLMLPKALQIG